MQRVGITGANGYVGRELLKHPNTFSLVADVTRPDEVEMAIKNGKPDLVVHLASVSNVDTCEDPKNREWVLDVNVRGTSNVAEACMSRGIGMVLLSTAQVFSGRWLVGYTEKDRPNPVNFYGLSKMGAEALQTIYPFMKIVRTSYLFDRKRLASDIHYLHGGNVREYPTFISRSFMYLPHFVDSFHQYLCEFGQMPNVLHLSGSKTISWYEFMRDLSLLYLIPQENIYPRQKERKDLAPRPHRAGLNVRLSEKLGFKQYSFADGITQMVQDNG